MIFVDQNSDCYLVPSCWFLFGRAHFFYTSRLWLDSIVISWLSVWERLSISNPKNSSGFRKVLRAWNSLFDWTNSKTALLKSKMVKSEEPLFHVLVTTIRKVVVCGCGTDRSFVYKKNAGWSMWTLIGSCAFHLSSVHYWLFRKWAEQWKILGIGSEWKMG